MIKRISYSFFYSIFYAILTYIVCKLMGSSYVMLITSTIFGSIGAFAGTFTGYGFGQSDRDKYDKE